MYPGKVDRVQLGLPIGNKSCLFRLVELHKSVGANLGQNKPNFRLTQNPLVNSPNIDKQLLFPIGSPNCTLSTFPGG